MGQKSPAFQFYVKDWISSAHVRVMGLAAKGLFIDLLALCWDNEGLPIDEQLIQRMVQVPRQTWNKVWPQVKPRFVQVNGRLWNPRILRIWLDLQRLSEIRSQAARKVERDGYVYAAMRPGADLVKIGITTDPDRRLASLRQKIPPRIYPPNEFEPSTISRWDPIVLLGIARGSAALERQAHLDLSPHHWGGEWFTIGGTSRAAVMAWIAEHLPDKWPIANKEVKQTSASVPPKNTHSASASAFASSFASETSSNGKASNSSRGGVGDAETASPSQRKISWPDGFQLTDRMRGYANSHGVDPEQAWEHFQSHHRAKASRFADWPQAWQTWIIKAVEYNHNGGRNGKRQSDDPNERLRQAARNIGYDPKVDG